MRNARTLSMAGILTAVTFSRAQAPTAFEVASVRPNTLDDRVVTINIGPGNRFAARGYTLVLLMQQAFGVMDWNVTGGPDWIRNDRFDVSAKASAGANLDAKQLQPMLQRLLEDRFKLKVHTTSKEMRGYALQAARGGPKLTKSPSADEHPETFRMNSTTLSGEAIAMPTLARFVAGKVGVIAVDETGLKGFYDFKADWKPDVDPHPTGDDSRDALRFAVFTALQEQLGLRMVAKRISVQMIVIDHAEKTSAFEN